MNFNFLILSPKKIYFDNFVHHIKLYYSNNNELEIYSLHTPILFFSKNIFIKIYTDKYKYFYIRNGFVEFKFNKLTLLINKCIEFNSWNKKKILFKKKKILKKIKKINDNINKFLKLNLKLKNYNNFLYFYKKNKNMLK